MSNSRDNFLRTQARHVRQCLKEARFVAVVCCLALLYCTIVFSTLGYPPEAQRPDTPQLVWGIPAWVAWGLFLPWLVLVVVTWLFATFILKDDEPYLELSDADDTAGHK